MREIKFRGKRVDTGEWIYGHYGDQTDMCCSFPCILPLFNIHKKDNFYNWAVEKETVGQFTGFCDKNGVEIYEGDVVEVYEPFNIPQVAKVKFNDGCFDVIGITLTFRDYLKCFVANNAIEIIGNIHEKEI